MRYTLPDPGTLPVEVEAIVAPAREAIAEQARLDRAAADARVARQDAERRFREAVRQAVVDGDTPPAEPKNLEQLGIVAEEADKAARAAKQAVNAAWSTMSAQLKQVGAGVLDQNTANADQAAADYANAVATLEAARLAYHEAVSVRRWLSSVCVPNKGIRPGAQAGACRAVLPARTPKAGRGDDGLDVTAILSALRLDAASLDTLRQDEAERRAWAKTNGQHQEHNRRIAAAHADNAPTSARVMSSSH